MVNPCSSIRVPKIFAFHSSDSCSKKKSVSIRVPKIFVTFERFVFKEKIRVHPCAKNIRYSSDSCSKKIRVHLCHLWENKIIMRVQKKQSTQVPHSNAEPRRTTFILSVMSGDYHSHLPTRPLPLPLYITSQPSCHSQYTYHEASR